ncbi:MAG: antitoxin [Desulfurococcales archaeon]|nr:antitoxin [Desulfurococcales archaeon]
MSVVVSFRIDRKLKERMEKLKHINWSEVVRMEEARLREKDRDRIAWASLKMDELRRKVEGWSSVEEIRRWRVRRGKW